MYTFRAFITAVIFCTLLMFSTVLPVVAAELDDSNLFVDAFNAYQTKDYLLTIDKITTLNQVFPDTPLRDVTLLLLARASMKAGDNELAAKTINQFNKEFATTPLISTIEEELLNLGNRLSKGEKLKSNKQLRTAAQKIRNEQLMLLKLAVQKQEQERLAKEKAEQARIALAKAELERKEMERIATEKADKASIKTAITISAERHKVISGQKTSIPFEIANLGKKQETFALEAVSPSDYNVSFFETNSTKPFKTITIAPGKNFHGIMAFQMPIDKVDGHKSKIALRVISARYKDVEQKSELQIIASAPLIRVVAKPAKAIIRPGEQTRYRITVLNLGSQASGDLSVRVVLPNQFDFIDAPGTSYRQENAGVFVFKIDHLTTGKLSELNLNLKVREDANIGQKLQSLVEIIDNNTQQKQSFNSVSAIIQKK